MDIAVVDGHPGIAQGRYSGTHAHEVVQAHPGHFDSGIVDSVCTTTFCSSAGFNPNIVMEAPAIDTISMLVADHCGVAFLAETVHNRMSRPRMNPQRPPYQVFHIATPNCCRNVGIAMRRDQSLSDTEYDFLIQLLFFFQPELADSSDLHTANIFVKYLDAHHYTPDTGIGSCLKDAAALLHLALSFIREERTKKDYCNGKCSSPFFAFLFVILRWSRRRLRSMWFR